MKRWLSYGALLVAAAAVVFGVTHAKGHTAVDNNVWVATLTNNVVQSHAENTASSTQGARTPANSAGNVGMGGAKATVSNAGGSTPASQVAPSIDKQPVSRPTTTGGGTKSAPAPANHGSTGKGSGLNGTGTAKTSTPTPPLDLGEFTIIVSEDKGGTVLSTKKLPIVKGESVMDYMHQNYQIETAYGDNFMVAIGGIKSQWTNVPVTQRQPVDWFLYVNGTQAPIGAGDIYPHSGDVDTWDYHRWDPSSGKG